jgi:hypothetical protein
MRTFNTATDVDAPAERVWQVMSDVDRWHEWTPSIISIKRVGSGPFAVGSQALVRQPKLPPALWTVTAIEPGRSFTWASTGPGLRVVGHHQVEPSGARSRALLSLEFQGIFGGLLGWILKGINDRYLAFEVSGLKARSENPEYRHSA